MRRWRRDSPAPVNGDDNLGKLRRGCQRQSAARGIEPGERPSAAQDHAKRLAKNLLLSTREAVWGACLASVPSLPTTRSDRCRHIGNARMTQAPKEMRTMSTRSIAAEFHRLRPATQAKCKFLISWADQF